ncbi:MAG TPA: hypothetical protein DEA08_39535, partial [Planctomycetes bacterium]|nr:hypothetical protein [Planctomycetota bacterium]
MEDPLEEARALRKAGSLAEAQRLLSEAIAARPDWPRAFNDRGCLRVELGDLDGALRDLAEALRLQPDYPQARRNFEIVSTLVGSVGDGGSAASTLSASLAEARGAGSFAHALVEYLREAVAVPAGLEDRREDAIQDVVLRVVGLSRADDLPLAEALRRLRRSSTRGWVR